MLSTYDKTCLKKRYSTLLQVSKYVLATALVKYLDFNWGR
jgi:hypothetical protein